MSHSFVTQFSPILNRNVIAVMFACHPQPPLEVCVWGYRLVSSFQVSRLRGAVLKELYLRRIVCTWTGFDEILDSG